MKSVEMPGEKISTDVLVIGGGISGLLAAIKARETVQDVLVIDKGGIGWAGQVPVSGGDCALFPPEEEEKQVQWLLEVGEGLNHPEWSRTFARDLYASVEETARLGLPFWREDGRLVSIPFGKGYRSTHLSPSTFMIRLKQAASARGIRTLDKVFLVDLLREDARVVGAAGFGLLDGKTYAIAARSTIIANGSCRYQAQRTFSVNTGEGVAMAFRAGAELANAEFANTYTFGFRGDIRRRIPLYPFFENALGERFIEAYYPGAMRGPRAGQEFLDFYQIAHAVAKEVEAGRGPIFIDFRKLTAEERASALQQELRPPEFRPVGRGDLLQALRERLGFDPESGRIEVELQMCGGQGPLRIDPACRTTVEGLLAVGDAGSLGSGYFGARASGTFGGFGIAFAIVSGLRGGAGAARQAAERAAPKPASAEVERLTQRMLAPLGRTPGKVSIEDVIYQVHEAIIPIRYNLHRERGRLAEALGQIRRARENLTRVAAGNPHELARYHQAESMALAAGWTLGAAQLREESRGTHRREDYPERDDRNWLKWVVIREEEGESSFSTEPLPWEARGNGRAAAGRPS